MKLSRFLTVRDLGEYVALGTSWLGPRNGGMNEVSMDADPLTETIPIHAPNRSSTNY